jgi:hypothetical protein
MTSIFFSPDEISALAYEANQLETAGYPSEAETIRRQPLSTTRITTMFTTFFSTIFASLFSRDLPAALAYEASQMQNAGYLPENDLTSPQPSFAANAINLVSITLDSLARTLFTRDLPAALAYEASQMAAAGYKDEPELTSRQYVKQPAQPLHLNTIQLPTHQCAAC